ncbi:hypothetical protein GPA10_22535 [Streptomyces sp. p1417]|uniref:Uncharacterized protein n=1 Tax=Streptomyces typhae TaxID=2681492 RepID=A0A6L6X106_9ACTN|nr:hypothetical protein [Streptomyces typhae]MVO87464.1 hypothetical protein [Streptomyces typhae]
MLRGAIPAACLAALYLSIPGEIALATAVGWSEHYAPAMPVCLSVYALAAGAIATYRRKMKLPGQVTALVGALAALTLAMGAQSISHLIEQSYMEGSDLLTVAVSCVPPIVIAHLIHMAETPSETRSVTAELAELREVSQILMAEVVVSETLRLSARVHGAVGELRDAISIAEELTGEAERLNVELGKFLDEEERKLREERSRAEQRRSSLARSIEEARASLGAEATVGDICRALGISQATYYRHKPKQVEQPEGVLAHSFG